MNTHAQTAADVRNNLAENLDWRFAERNELPNPEIGAWVLLTNGPIDEPWTLVDAYDDRSWMENGLFRNAKQF